MLFSQHFVRLLKLRRQAVSFADTRRSTASSAFLWFYRARSMTRMEDVQWACRNQWAIKQASQTICACLGHRDLFALWSLLFHAPQITRCMFSMSVQLKKVTSSTVASELPKNLQAQLQSIRKFITWDYKKKGPVR